MPSWFMPFNTAIVPPQLDFAALSCTPPSTMMSTPSML
jgi:hypothetical protein